MFGPGRHTESETLVGNLEMLLAAIRTSAYGLTDEQARETPCRSTLSIGGLVKHTTYVMERRVGEPMTLDEAGFALFTNSFVLADDETLDGALAAFDRTRTAYLDDVRAADPGADLVSPPAPWDGIFAPVDSVQRFALVHHVEEFARHAGHADIIRQELDGAEAGSLTMAADGIPGNDFAQPWTPPG